MSFRCAAPVLCVALLLGPGRTHAQGVLSSLGELSVDGASLDDARVPVSRRVGQARALGRWGDPHVAVSVLIETLSRRPSEPLRSAVIQALAERRAVDAVPELVRALRGRMGSTAWLIQALSAIGGTSVIEPMIELTKHGDRSLRDAALRVLVRVAPDRAAPLMLEAGSGSDSAERQRVLSIAITHPNRLWLSLLQAGLREPRSEGDTAALTWALTRLPEGAGFPGLVAAAPVTGDLPLHLRVALAVTLRAHGQHLTEAQREQALSLLKRGGTAAERERLGRLAVGKDDPDATSSTAADTDASAERSVQLRKALRARGDEAIAQRVSAARQLGSLADPKAHVPLIAALADSSPDVRRTAVAALARLDRAQATSALQRHVTLELDPEVAELTALALNGDRLALDDPWFRGRQLRASLVDRQVAPLAP